ncbi:MAG: alpha/beta hydrolase, partial [Alphaproteobacteria bacterium]|nr:alpha/beta hydrolase [Alphaproteobacteria bacterium]
SGGSESPTSGRLGTAYDIAAPVHMQRRNIAASPFNLTVFERVGTLGQEATIYIEGDGLAWISRRTPSFDPTPKRPTALKLAALDPSVNVIYMARPCQYSKTTNPQEACNRKYWMEARFAPEAVASMDKAIDDIKSRYHVPAFHLVGYSGGGGMTVLLAAQRDDIASLRTVAGNLDHVVHSRMHKVSLLSDSLNPRDYAARIAQIPQNHFIGADDKNVTVSLYESFSRAAAGMRRASHCLHKTIVPNATHEKGWEDQWSSLLALPLGCHE